MRIGINGFGRIGRCVLRAFYEGRYCANDLQIVAINSRSDARSCAHLLQYDSVHGKFACNVSVNNGLMLVNDDVIQVTSKNNPEDIDWLSYGVDLVFECSGYFKSKKSAIEHSVLNVIVSAPVADADRTVIYGVNHGSIKISDKVISCGSCTTNCAVPVVYLLHKKYGIKHGFMTTVHSYTNDQNIMDNSHKDLRRARACALSMIPTSTGAAKSIGKIIPELSGKIDGAAVRVPVPNVSMVDFKFTTNKSVTVDEINEFMQYESQNSLRGIIDVSAEYLVSVDFLHNAHSAVFDCVETRVVDNNCVRVLAWYDNEWGFANRMLDIARVLNDKKNNRV